MRILVIIVAYNFERWIDRCLGSLRRSTLRPDVLVVDNGSTDGTVATIKSRWPEVRLVATRQNLGFGQANNIGMRMACDEGYDAVYLLNQDAWLMPDTLQELSRLSQEHPECGILSPVHLDGTEQALDHGFAHYSRLATPADADALVSQGREVVEVPFVNAAHWFIPVAALKRVGGFSPLFFMYGEDVDWVNRLHHCGLTVAYAPQARAVHARETRDGAGVSNTAKYRASYVYLLSEYANVNRSVPSAFAYSVLASVKSLAKALLSGRWSDVAIYANIGSRLLAQTPRVLRERHAAAGIAPYL